MNRDVTLNSFFSSLKLLDLPH